MEAVHFWGDRLYRQIKDTFTVFKKNSLQASSEDLPSKRKLSCFWGCSLGSCLSESLLWSSALSGISAFHHWMGSVWPDDLVLLTLEQVYAEKCVSKVTSEFKVTQHYTSLPIEQKLKNTLVPSWYNSQTAICFVSKASIEESHSPDALELRRFWVGHLIVCIMGKDFKIY